MELYSLLIDTEFQQANFVMKLDLRPKLQQDLEASCKYPGVSHLEIWSELNTSELICGLLHAITNTRTTVRTMLQHSAYAEWHITNSLPGRV